MPVPDKPEIELVHHQVQPVLAWPARGFLGLPAGAVAHLTLLYRTGLCKMGEINKKKDYGQRSWCTYSEGVHLTSVHIARLYCKTKPYESAWSLPCPLLLHKFAHKFSAAIDSLQLWEKVVTF